MPGHSLCQTLSFCEICRVEFIDSPLKTLDEYETTDDESAFAGSHVFMLVVQR